MNNTYNSNTYLNTSDLNTIENLIESITNEIQEKIFNNQTSSLRNIQVGDNLSSKTLYDSFPPNIYNSISGSGTNVIVTDTGKYIYYQKTTSGSTEIYRIHLVENKTRILYQLYSMLTGKTVTHNGLETSLPYNMGVVTQINTNNNIYQYMKIYENENIIPNYVKHVWQDNELPSMQKITNIERGIKNIGRYFYEPYGWVPTVDWIVKDGNSVRTKSISYVDLNRWYNNLSLINFDNLDELTLWNTEFTQLDWNKYSDIEWEEL